MSCGCSNTNKNDGNHVSVGRGNINNNTNNQEVNRGVQQMNLPQNNVMNHQEGGNTNMQNVANEPPLKIRGFTAKSSFRFGILITAIYQKSPTAFAVGLFCYNVIVASVRALVNVEALVALF